MNITPPRPVPIRIPRFRSLIGLTFTLFPAWNLLAQSTVGEPAEPVIQLSPFEVTTENDVGYQAGNTTSGSRMNSSLKDTAASIMAFTPEFMADFNVTSLADMIAYTPNMSADMLQNSADANPTFLGGSDLSDTRILVRGLSASTARDFFDTKIAIDAYNTERVELSSGPNSILFGFGAPGGLVNVMTKRAQLNRNRTSIRGQAGDWDFSRGQIDHNQIIVPGKLALRLNGLLSDANGWRKWDFSETQQGTASLRFTPFKKTNLTLSYEKGASKSHVSRPLNAYDSLLLWQTSGAQTMTDAAWTTASRANGINRDTNTRIYYVTNADGSSPYTLTTANSTNNRILVSSYENLNTASINRQGLTMVSSTLVPFNISTYGPGSIRNSDFNRFNAAIEQRLTENITLELAYNRERTAQDIRSIVPGNHKLYGDPNLTIPNPDGSGTLITNANAGKLFFEGQWNGDKGEANSDVVRASLAWELDLGNLGKHKLAVMGEHGELHSYRLPQQEILVDASGVPLNNTTVPETATNFIWRRNYITTGNYNTYYAGNGQDSFSVTRNGKTYTSRWINSSTAAGNVERTMNTAMVATQSSFWKNHIIVTAGVRQDEITFDSFGSSRYVATDPEVIAGTKIVNELKYSNTVESTQVYKPLTGSEGVVYHINNTFSVFYNHANNNSQPPISFRILPDLALPKPFDGEGDDYGFMVNLFEGKVFLRATAFQTTLENAVGGSFAIPLSATSGENDLVSPSTRILDTLLANGYITSAEYTAHAIPTSTNLSGSSDVKNTGYELSVWLNPTKNFTGILNFSYTKTDRTSIVPEFETWYARENAFWHSKSGAGSLVNSTSGLTIDGESAAIVDTMEGVREYYGQAYGERPYKINLNGRYTFPSGALKGVFVGGGGRWQSKSLLGRTYLGRTSSGLRILGDPYYGPEDFKLDAVVGIRRKLPLFSGTKVDASFQINVTNLTDEDELLPLRYNNARSGYYRVLLRDPRQIRFTAGFEF